MAKENEEGLRKILDFSRAIGIFFYILNVYWYCYPFFKSIIPEKVVEKLNVFFTALNDKLGLFEIPYITIIGTIVFITLYNWAERGKKDDKYEVPFFICPIIAFLEKMNIIKRDDYVEEENNNGKKVRMKMRVRKEGWSILLFGLFLIIICPIFLFMGGGMFKYFIYILLSAGGIMYFIYGSNYVHKMYRNLTGEDDPKNDIQETFLQCETLMNNEYSVNLRTEYKYQSKVREGWINVVNPFRATSVLGTPGSGKSYAVINEFIRQHLSKFFTMYCYDFKFPDLSTIVYNHMKWHENEFLAKYGVRPKFCVINFDDPRKSLRCNPIDPRFMNDITDAYDSAYTIMLNLNKSWAQKQGDFFVESPINYLTATIWYLKEVEGGKYCTLPHVIEWINSKYTDCIPIMYMNDSLVNYMSAFFETWEGGAQDQLQGQIASVRIPLSRISSPQLYWIMCGNDFTLDLNNPEEPKVLCVGNNPEKKDIYAAALGLYNGRIVKVINKKHKHKISLIIDELPTMYFRGLDNLIATARSNKVSICLGYQDFTQLIRDYGDKEAKAIINTIGNLFSGQVTGDTAKNLEARFGRNKQKRKSISYQENGVSTSISEQNDTMIPASKIATLTQGTFVGAVADNFGEEISEKIFHSIIKIDNEGVQAEERAYHPLPTFYSFDTKDTIAEMKEMMVEFLRKRDNYVLLMEYRDKIKDLLSETDIQMFLQKVFAAEGSKEKRISEEISHVGETIKQQLLILSSNLEIQNAKMGSSVSEEEFRSNFEKMKRTILDFLSLAEIKTWIEKESKNSEGNEGAMTIKKTLGEFLKSMNELSFENRARGIKNIEKYIEPLMDHFDEIRKFKKNLQAIRDRYMHRKLEENEDKIRQDIKGLIERQLKRMEEDERFKDIWERRESATSGQ